MLSSKESTRSGRLLAAMAAIVVINSKTWFLGGTETAPADFLQANRIY